MYAHVRHCLQPQKDDEVQHQPTDGSSNKPDHRINRFNKLIHFLLENSIPRIGKQNISALTKLSTELSTNEIAKDENQNSLNRK